MTALLIVVVALATLAGACVLALWEAFAEERRRTAELLTLIEAQRAPAEYAGYVAQAPAEPGPQYLFSDDGLIGIPLPEDT